MKFIEETNIVRKLRSKCIAKGDFIRQTRSKTAVMDESKEGKVLTKTEQKKGGQLVLFNALQIQQYNLYWVKLRGFPMWPAIVEEIIGNNRFCIHFFGDYTTSIVYRNSFLYNFVDGMVAFNGEKKLSKNVKLCKSVKEASMHHIRFGTSKQQKSCSICDFLK